MSHTVESILSARRRSVRRPVLLLATTALTSPLLIVTALAQTPTGGSVAAGSVAITQPSATQVNITQSSQSAVVNWQSFSVGPGSSVNIAQPNTSSALLNRVTGNTPSTIAGSISANGQVYLVNPNGIAITTSGTVNTGGGFVASTLGISDSDFMNGKRTFTGNGASAPVTNAGSITVGRGGYAALIGGTVSNSGTINVPLGKVALGSGEQATLDFAGDGFLQVAMPTSADGGGSLITNSGAITANGGSVTISAATAREAARNAVNMSGTVQARSIGGHDGAIVIGGGEGGAVEISGRLDTSSRHKTGGSIAVIGNDIKLRGATVNSSGRTGGGTIAIGGGRQGSGPLQHARTTSVDRNTVVKADAITSGNGGSVVIWSDQLTTFAGTVSARGGALGGDGGFVETSGQQRLSVLEAAFVDTRAPMGVTGNWLLDPHNITVATGGAATAAEALFNSGNNAADITIAPTTINAAASNVTLQANNDITISNAISMTNPVSLTLNAGRSILVNANVVSKGGFTATINDAGATSANRDSGKAAFTMAAGTSISTAATTAGANGGAVSITTGTLAADSTGAQALAANIGDITLAAITTSGLGGASSSGAGGSITVTNSQGSILSAASGTVALTANAAAATSGTAAGKAGGAVQLTATNGAIGSAVTSLGTISAVGGNGLGTNQAGGNGGAITLVAGTNIWDRAITTTAGVKTGTGTSGSIGTILNQASNGSITMTADTLSASGLTFTANASTGTVTIVPATATTTMSVNGTSTLNLTAAVLANVTANTLVIGNSASTGQLTVGPTATTTIPTGVTNLVLTSASSDNDFGGIYVKSSISGSTKNVTLNATDAAGLVYLEGGTINVASLTATGNTISSSGSNLYNNAAGTVSFTATGVSAFDGTSSLALQGGITAGTLKLTAPSSGQIYQGTAAYKVTNLVARGGSFIDLSGGNNTNQITNFAANTTGRIKMQDNVNLAVATVDGVNGVTANQFNLAFASTGKSITQTAPIVASEFSLVGSLGSFVTTATLTNAGNSIGTFAASVSTGTISLAGVNGLTIGQLRDSQDNTLATGVTAGTLTLSNTGTVTQSSKISATNLLLLGTGGIYNLTSSSNAFATVAANTGSVNLSRSSAAALATGTVNGTAGITTTGDATLTSAGNVTVGATGAINAGGAVTLTTTGAATDIALNGAVNASSGTLTLNGKHNITQAAAGTITAANLLLLGTGGSHTLTNTGNSVGTVAANTGTMNLVDNVSLTVGTVGGTNGVTGSGAVTLASANNITIDPTARVVAGANSNAVLSAAASFINNRGSDAIGVSGTGRWLVYSNAPANDTFGGLDSHDAAIWHQTMATLAPGSVPGNNRYIFAYQPTLTFASTNPGKTYGADATATVASSFAVTGLQSGVAGAFAGDTLSAVYGGAPAFTSTGSAAGAAVGSGTYAIAGSNGTLTSLAGYSLAVVGGTLTVNPAALTITASNQSKAYGQTASLGTTGFTTSGLVNGDAVTGVTLASLGAAGSAGVNGGIAYSLNASAAAGSGLANYTISYVSGGLTVNPAALTITASNQSKTYGQSASLGTTGFTTSGLVNGDAVTGVTLASLGAAGSAGVNGGIAYSLNASAAAGSGLANYTIGYVSGGLTVNPAALTITASNQSKTYGQSASLGTTGFTTSGLVNGDAVTVVTLASLGAAGSAGVNGGAAYSLDASAASGSGLSNYTIGYVSGGLTVNPAALTITASNQSKTYGQTASLGTTGFTTSGLVNGDAVTGVTLASLGAAGSAGVNGGVAYSLDASAATGSGLANYTIGYVSGGLTVNPAALTITASNQSKTYGQTASLGTTGFTTSGLVNGDAVTGVTLASLGTAASAGVNGGIAYSLDASAASGSGLSNYTIGYVSGGLTVNPAALTITASNQSKTYGQTASLGTTGFTTSGLVNGDAVTGVTLASLGAAGSAGVNGGVAYSLDASAARGSGLANYTIGYVSGGLTVNPAALTITANNTSKTFGQSLTFAGVEFSASGLANGETVGSVALASAGAAASANVAGSPYAITASGATGGTFNPANYTIRYVNGALTVAPANVKVTTLASDVVRDSFHPVVLPDHAQPVAGAANIVTDLGTGVFYADPRFDHIFVCFAGGSCFAAGNSRG